MGIFLHGRPLGLTSQGSSELECTGHPADVEADRQAGRLQPYLSADAQRPAGLTRRRPTLFGVAFEPKSSLCQTSATTQGLLAVATDGRQHHTMTGSQSTKPVILVTGASRGIGLSIVSFLLGATPSKTIQTAKIVTLSRSLPQALADLQEAYPEDLETVQGDILHESLHKRAVEAAQQKWGRLDAMVLNAGSMEIGRVGGGDLPPSSFANQISINLSSLFTTCHYALPVLRKAPSGLGRVVFISSGAAIGNYSAWAAYNASKAGLNALARTVANEEQEKVAVWAVRPGVVDTNVRFCGVRRRLGHKKAVDHSHNPFVPLNTPLAASHR